MRISGLIGGGILAAVLSQFPAYTQQYEQRLGGAVDQLRVIVADFDASAGRAGLTRDQALAVYDQTGETFLADRSRDMQAAFVRYEKLSAHLSALQNAGPVEKLTAFTQFYDPEVGERALEAFEPAVPVTTESALWTGAGLLAGYGLTAGVAAGARRVRGPGRPRITRD